ncbi:MAG: malto-oligosyltrehalose trehalohydrolase [Desulfomonile tiedjei]|nr:malto-oligosyltrehalose trehalohydrolase [Desulfomonile tiedjei]
MKPGASLLSDGRCTFCVWAPFADEVRVHIVAPIDRVIPLTKSTRGYHHGLVANVEPQSLYFYQLSGRPERPDPASRSQPRGVHGPSEIVDPEFLWRDESWPGIPLIDYVLYELHVGTFTREGTFDAIIPYLDGLKDLGITAIELMPVAQFPGDRNWGYDGAYPYAVQNSYGGAQGLKRLVEACHGHGLAVVLDVVYNHLGPEGNYLAEFGPYFTDRYRTLWGDAINFDGPHSDEVRRFFIDNAIFWVTEFHIDALRIDAIHGIFDFSARHILEELAAAVHERADQLNRRIHVIAESDLNDSRVIRSRDVGGYGLDAQWNDDFHHCIHTLLTDERAGYYSDFGEFQHLVKAFREGFVYSGQHSSYRLRGHGNPSAGVPRHRFVVFAQNHDQVGNRIKGDRLSALVSLEALKLAAGVVLLSPFIPLLFMGEEYRETAPFPYFVSHSDPDLVEAVRRGRKEEFASFQWTLNPPDPQAETTYLSAKLDHELARKDHHRILYEYYKDLIRVRKGLRALIYGGSDPMEISGFYRERTLILRRRHDLEEAVAIFHFSNTLSDFLLPLPAGSWAREIDSSESNWGGPGSTVPSEVISEGELSLRLNPYSIVLLRRNSECVA